MKFPMNSIHFHSIAFHNSLSLCIGASEKSVTNKHGIQTVIFGMSGRFAEALQTATTDASSRAKLSPQDQSLVGKLQALLATYATSAEKPLDAKASVSESHAKLS